MQILLDCDKLILDLIQSLKCSFLDFLMPVISALADNGYIWILCAVILLCIKSKRRYGFMAALALIMGFIVCNLILKQLIGRIRPYEYFGGVQLLIEPLADYSFPSGHTIASFEVSAVIFRMDKRWGVPAFALSALIAFSRIYLYVHYPSDILASIILGIAIGFLSVFILNKKETYA